MVGLSVLLEAQTTLTKTPQIISKTTILIKPSSPPTPTALHSPTPLPSTTFLDACFLCKKRLSPGRDTYMYRGDRAFCSVECRRKQILMDEEISTAMKENCWVAASRRGKGNRKRGGGLFAC